MFVGDRLAALSEDYLLDNIPLNYYTVSAVLQSKFHTDARNLSSLNSKGEKYYTAITISLQLLATAIAWVLASSSLCKVENLAKLGQARGKEEDETVGQTGTHTVLPQVALCLWTRENLALLMLTRSFEPALASVDVSALCL